MKVKLNPEKCAFAGDQWSVAWEHNVQGWIGSRPQEGGSNQEAQDTNKHKETKQIS